MASEPAAGTGHRSSDDRYKWVALANTTAAMFMATLDGSIVIIALPAIFRGIHLDPLAPGNISYLLWMIMGYRLVQAVLVVNVGRLGDMFGRVRIYNAGFVVFTFASILLSFDPFDGSRGALWLIGWRVLQAVGVWLPLHGYSYSATPLWAGIYLLPLTAGFLISGPTSGTLSDRFGSRGLATAGMAVFGGSFIGLMLLPANFSYWAFALLIAANGIGSGMFASPNSSSIMGSVPARQRGVASGMRSTFPGLLSVPFHHGLVVVFAASATLAALAGLASVLRGGRPTATAGEEARSAKTLEVKLSSPTGACG